MDGALAQVIAIATHGSAWMRDPSSVDLDDFAAHNSTFRYVGELTFVGRDDVRPWLKAQAAGKLVMALDAAKDFAKEHDFGHRPGAFNHAFRC